MEWNPVVTSLCFFRSFRAFSPRAPPADALATVAGSGPLKAMRSLLAIRSIQSWMIFLHDTRSQSG